MCLRKRPDSAPGKCKGRLDRPNARLVKRVAEEHLDGRARRLTRRLREYARHIFTFEDYEAVGLIGLTLTGARERSSTPG
jgi:hypothetical protein